MTSRDHLKPPLTPAGLVVRTASLEDNDELIALELETPLLIGDVEEFFNRSPDTFAYCAPHPGCRLVVATLDGRIVGMLAGLVHSPVLQGKQHRLVYIHRGRVLPEFHHRGVGWALSTELFAWAAQFGSTGPYYLIAPGNERSIAFGGRAGGRWPVDVALVEFDVSDADGAAVEVLGESLDEAVELINDTHEGEDFFEPLDAERLRARRQSYGRENLVAATDGGRLVAVAALWDKGATTERIDVNPDGTSTRTRSAVVVDWGFASGQEGAFAALLRGLAARARALGRDELTICEPRPGAVPDIGLPRRHGGASLFTPALPPQPREAIAGLYMDLLYM